MSSKLQFLSKYIGKNDEKKKLKKKKKSRKSEKSGRLGKSDSILYKDDDDDFKSERSSDNSNNINDEDRPVVVSTDNDFVNDNTVTLTTSDTKVILDRKRQKIENHDSAMIKNLDRNHQNSSSSEDVNRNTIQRKRHDSSSDESTTANKVKFGRMRHENTNKNSSSSHDSKGSLPKRRSRYDSSDNESNLDVQKVRTRHDTSSSDDDVATDEKNKYSLNNQSRRYKHSTQSRKERHRHDSSSEEDASRVKPRTRHDSSSDDNEKNVKSRHRHDSSSEEDASHDKPRTRHDSSSDNGEKNRKRRHRHDSSSDEEGDSRVKPRTRHDSSSDDDKKNDINPIKKSAADRKHATGLQSGATFSKNESKIREKSKNEAMLTIDKYGVGETVYRDETGRKVDKPVARPKNNIQQLDAEERLLLQTSKVQRSLMEEKKKEMTDLQTSTFARHRDDTDLENYRKSIIYKDDPMAAHEYRKQQKTQSNNEGGEIRIQRPMYKGPPAKPNRFGIKPGHRWDAKDRGNGFEDKLLAIKYSTQHKKEEAYRYLSADM